MHEVMPIYKPSVADVKAQSVRRWTLFERFAFEPSTAIAFKSLKSDQSRWTIERFKIADEG